MATKTKKRRRMIVPFANMEAQRVQLGLSPEEMLSRLGYKGSSVWGKWRVNGAPKTAELAGQALLNGKRGNGAGYAGPRSIAIDGVEYWLIPKE